MTQLITPMVPVSWGELIDKITILEIKRTRIGQPEAHANVEREYRQLHGIAAATLDRPGVAPLVEALRMVNRALWDIEDAVRRHEATKRFDTDFVALARSVYQRNDERAAIKRAINTLLGSELVEEKSYVSVAEGAISTAPVR